MSFIGKVTNFLNFGAVKINPQPLPVPCTTNSVFCQPTNQQDQIAFQFEASESTELITNGDFEVDPFAAWTIVGWSRVLSAGNNTMIQTSGVNALSQKGILTINDFYRVKITITNMPDGGILHVGGGTGSVPFNSVFVITSDGTYNGYFQYTEAGGAGDFIIAGVLASSAGVRVDDVSVIKISDTSDYNIEIIDQETSIVIETLPIANMQLKENIITVDFVWADDVTISNGCRQIQIIDNTNLFEDNFSSNQGWTIAPDITFTGTRMLFTSTGTKRNAFIDDVFVVGETYEITLISAGMGGGGSLNVRCGNTLGGIRTTNNTFVETIVCTGTGRLTINFKGAAAATAAVDNLTIKKVDNIAGRSSCYDLQTSHDCTLLFAWSNNESWGGFDYSVNLPGATSTFPTFVHRLRLEAKFRGTNYPSNRIIGENSAGVKSMNYTSFRKSKILDIHRSPDYIHDAIGSMWMQDNRTIEDISYIMEDEYEPSPPNESRVLFKDFMTSRSELEETEQPNLINRNV